MGGFQLPNTSPQHLFLLGPVIYPSAMLMPLREVRHLPPDALLQYEWWMAICARGSSGLFFFNSGTGWHDVTYQLISVLWLCKYSKTYPVYNLNIHTDFSVTLQNNRFFMFLSCFLENGRHQCLFHAAVFVRERSFKFQPFHFGRKSSLHISGEARLYWWSEQNS